ncbi:golgin subfamily A member 6-like protein 22 [Astatotilapia calliptera]|uniref:golgin subfamily A member 6-like protein 22 n=1 Tax=Astatotilapia calliptera TaxID=8154 RepID=UPI000E40F0AF|nr:golgin subfamily A member 6-like protein 22 [Astatotilapia calliptera]
MSNETFMELQMKIQQLQLKLSTLKLKKNNYKDNFHQSRDELKHVKAQAEQNQTQVESLEAKLQEQEKNVQTMHHDMIKKEKIIEKQYREILRKIELTVELKREICTLQRRVRQTLDDKQSQVESLQAKMHENTTESQTLQIFWLEEKVKKQNFKIVHNEDLIDELYEHLKIKGEIINNLKDQLRREQEEKILAAVHNITGEPLQLENLAPEPEDLFFPALENLAPEPEDLFFPALEPSPDVVPTQQNLAPEPEELVSPVSEPSPDVVPTSGSWCHGAKRLLKIGLGVAAVGLIIAAGYWGFSVLNSDCLFNSVYGLLEPYCHLGDRLVPF